MGLPLRVHLHWTSHQTTRHLTKNRQWTRHLNQDQNYKEKTKQCLDIVFCSKQRKESGTPLMLKKLQLTTLTGINGVKDQQLQPEHDPKFAVK